MRTQVSKASTVIRKILANTVGSDWRGWVVHVEEIGPAWSLQLSPDAREPLVYRTTTDGKPLRRNSTASRQIARSPIGVVVHSPPFGEVVVVKQTGTGPHWHSGPVTIYIPHLDKAQLDVARDAQMSLGRSDSRSRELIASFGPYSGIAQTVLDAQQKTLTSSQRGKSSRQLDREIAEILRSRAQ